MNVDGCSRNDMLKFLARQVLGMDLPKLSGVISTFSRITFDCEFSDSENMERLRKCFSGPARDCVKMILLTNDAENAIVMLKRNYGRSEKIVEQHLEEAKAQKPVTDSNDFQEFSNLVENLSVTVENDGEMSQFTNKIVTGEFFKKLPESIMDGKTIQTKREVLHITMSLSDPRRFLSPVTIASRILMQEIWKPGLGWDDQLSKTLYEKWQKWLKQLQQI
jgi:hypothetical protein